jgi:transglutaminase-like putative cysteine protease
MQINILTLIIILINAALMSEEVPTPILAIIGTSLISSLFISAPKIRVFIKISLLVISIAFLRFYFRTLFVTECAVSFILVLSALKFWELKEERDHFNMFLILSLLECCIFLIRPSFLVFALGLSKMIFYFYYILKIRKYDLSQINTKRLVTLLVPSLLFSVLLFYTFPRFTQGFINAGAGPALLSGLSSDIDFKKLGPLNLSSQEVFKVTGLEKTNLPFSLLYWRTSVLWHFSSQEWHTSNTNLKVPETPVLNPEFKYTIEMLSDIKEYLPTLDGPSSIIASELKYSYFSDESFRLKVPSRDHLQYSLQSNYGSFPYKNNPLMLNKGVRIKSTRLNEVKEKYFAGINFSDDEDKLQKLTDIFKKKNFEYSLSPPVYASIEDFLLRGKSGYCSHFATGFTFLARTIGLPSRVVTGFLGGELNPYDGSVIVRELDAHAWVEVFINKRGWVKIDPTALVAPARIQMSARDFNLKLDPYITLLNLKIDRNLFSFSFFNNLSLWLDSINSKLSGDIINFDREKQLNLLSSLISKNLSPIWIFTSSVLLLIAVFWLLFYSFGKRINSPDEKRYLKFLKVMKREGLSKETHETASQFGKRCQDNLPTATNFINAEIEHYLKIFYGPPPKKANIDPKTR